MASLPAFTQFSSLPRWHSNLPSISSINFPCFGDVRLRGGFVVTAIRRKKVVDDGSDGEIVDSEKKTRKRAPSQRKKKDDVEGIGENSSQEIRGSNVGETSSDSTEVPTKPQRRTRKKVASTSSSLDEEPGKKPRRRRRTTKISGDSIEEVSETELSEPEEEETDDDKELEIDPNNIEDISFTYAWPPLICCFGPIQHAFVPSGRPANRLIDHESHERMKDALWAPEKFVRAPGGGVGDVALSLARIGGSVAMMGKIGDDDFGQALLYYLNVSKVQTRAVRIDPKRATGVSRMKMSKRGGLRMTCARPCAEDTLLKSEINVDVLKEAKMFYFNSFSLLDPKTKQSVLQAIKISKQFGGVIFFDLNLPLPLWHSREETQTIIQEAFELSDIIEVTKQELEFLCGIVPSERFDTKDNDRLKFVHYGREVVDRIRPDNLEVLFVTNGTSKIHYYTKEKDGAVLGMEDPPVTPFTSDMAAAGDGVVAALASKLTVQPHLMTDKAYLEHSINYAINCGVAEQWLRARRRGYPPKPDMENDDFDLDPNGIKTITEKEYRTLVPVREDFSEDLGVKIEGHAEEPVPEATEVNGDSSEDVVENTERYENEPEPEVNEVVRA